MENLPATPAAALDAVRGLLADAVRDDTYPSLYRVMAELEKLNGKKLTKRNLPDLEAAAGEALFMGPNRFGSYRLENAAYRRVSRDGEQTAWCLTFNRDGSCPVVDTDWLRSDHTCYFDAAEKRNALRQQLLGDGERIARLGELIASINNAAAELRQLTAYPCPDGFRIQRLAGFD